MTDWFLQLSFGHQWLLVMGVMLTGLILATALAERIAGTHRLTKAEKMVKKNTTAAVTTATTSTNMQHKSSFTTDIYDWRKDGL